MPGRIDIVGLGPGDPSLRTIATQAILDAASRIFFRTGIHPGLEDLLGDPRVSTCDDLYQSHTDFAAVYDAISTRVVDAAKLSDVVFAVPGHPKFGEQTTTRIKALATESSIEVRVHASVSALDAVATSIDFDAFADELQIIDAETLDAIWNEQPFSGGQLAIEPTRPCLVGQIFSKLIASHVKLTLGRIYPEDHLVVIIRASGVPGEESLIECPLYEVDHQPVDHLSTLFVPPVQTNRTASSVERLVAHLRSPKGCPWDRRQSHASLRDAMLEEAFEVVDAIDESDPHQLAEELGDLFLLIAMHAQIADESGDFAIEDVYEHISRKLIRRHPHVFGDALATTPDEVVATWEGVKRAERVESGLPQNEFEVHPIDRLPRSMPATTRVARVLNRFSGLASSANGDARKLAIEFYKALEAMIAADLDPDVELIKIARERIPGDQIARDGSPEI